MIHSDKFPRFIILILKSEDFFSNPKKVLSKVTDFLKLPNCSASPEMFRIYNSGYYSEMSIKMRRHLADYFAPHNEKLYKYLGVDFGWETDDYSKRENNDKK